MGVGTDDLRPSIRNDPAARALYAALCLCMRERDLAKAQRDELAAVVTMCRMSAGLALQRAGYPVDDILDVEPTGLLTEDQIPR